MEFSCRLLGQDLYSCWSNMWEMRFENVCFIKIDEKQKERKEHLLLSKLWVSDTQMDGPMSGLR